ncbi:hypothetical protein HHI36_000929 [Cryptolaemus montrouzieri]|uniref:Acyltransferase n=1 Tax=Cryptolaemus montrouzieri TaxID=559131 RepID=A0ABD2P702_9CUCU
MSIEYAPLEVLLKQRSQMLAIIAYVFFILLAIFPILTISTYIMIYTQYIRILYLAYVAWIFMLDRNISSRGGRQFDWVKQWSWWKYMADYFPMELVKLPNCRLDRKRNYLFCCFPHGMMATGAFTTLLTESRGFSKKFPDHRAHMHSLRVNFFIPFLRELLLAIGAVSSSAESLNHILSQPEGGNITALIVGGAKEAFYSEPGYYRIVLKNRKGFVKIALKNGAPLVPVISFGEPDVIPHWHFKQGSIFLKLQTLVKRKFGFFPLVPECILPNRRAINIVVGEPIDVTKVERPTQEQIDELHQKFIEKLTQMFESQKKKYLKNYEAIHLEVI